MARLTLFPSLAQDLRHALRALRRSPGFTAAAVTTLALGIGANAALFSVISAVLLRPPPYRDPDRLVTLTTYQASAPEDDNATSLPDLRDWQAQNTVFEGVAGYGFNRYELNGPEGVDLARAVMGTDNLFSVLGARPLAGRVLTPSDDHQAVVVLSHRLWMQRYGGSADVIGRTVRLYQDPYTIVGVMPAGFHFPTPDIDLWTSLEPIYRSSGKGSVADWLTNRSLRGYRVVARLKPGITAEAAGAQMQALQQRLAQSYPESDAGLGVTVRSLRESTVAGFRRPLLLLLGAAGLVLLIACVNLAHLLLARTSTR
ncbi:MAG TPA: ABC transporter permease, partial [Gemmatimonadales bacterium]|nr:ABC transporter permease [Gemmatimonadales bacterium]